MKWRTHSVQYCVALMALYLIASLLIPLSRETREAYNLSLAQAHIISFITILPLFGIWFVAFYAYGLLQKYARAIRHDEEGVAFSKIADGVMILSWGLVAQAFASLILGWVGDQAGGMRATVVVLQSYITLIFPLIAFSYIWSGTQKLLGHRKNVGSLMASRTLLLVFAGIAAAYVYLVLRLHEQSGSEVSPLPALLLLVTIIVPYLFAWFSGITAAYELTVHARLTRGLLYKRALNLLAGGLAFLIVATIAMQYFNSMFLSNLGEFSINAVLLVDYLLLLMIALGYVIVIAGVRGLQKIEEV